MDPFTMVIAIVVVVTLGNIASQFFKSRQKSLDALLASRGDGDPALEAQVRALKARVEALEAIVTDPRHDLKREFQRLESEDRRSVAA